MLNKTFIRYIRLDVNMGQGLMMLCTYVRDVLAEVVEATGMDIVELNNPKETQTLSNVVEQEVHAIECNQ